MNHVEQNTLLLDLSLVKIDEIIVEDRSREVDHVWVDALAAMFRHDEMLNPITLWQSEAGPRLVAGAHRLAAQKQNGETYIAARWSKATTLAEAKVQEITENIGRRELSALDRAQHLFDLKEAYEALYPEAKQGGDRKSKEVREKQNEIISFRSDTAEKIGLSERAINLAVSMWKGLSVATRSKVRGTWLADHQASLIALSKENAGTQAKVLEMIFPPADKQTRATNIPDALYILQNGRLPSAVERRFAGLNKSIQNLADDELDAILVANEERIMLWVSRRLDGLDGEAA